MISQSLISSCISSLLLRSSRYLLILNSRANAINISKLFTFVSSYWHHSMSVIKMHKSSNHKITLEIAVFYQLYHSFKLLAFLYFAWIRDKASFIFYNVHYLSYCFFSWDIVLIFNVIGIIISKLKVIF